MSFVICPGIFRVKTEKPPEAFKAFVHKIGLTQFATRLDWLRRADETALP